MMKYSRIFPSLDPPDSADHNDITDDGSSDDACFFLQ